jgi:hypothetical protein
MKHNINEEVDITPYVERGNIDVDSDPLRDNINTFLHGVTGMCFVTPYIALEKVRKVLANFHIHLNRVAFLENEDGYVSFPVRQFGNVMGMKNNGEIVSKVESPYHVYFEWRMKPNGMYNIFCEIVDQSELAELISDYEDELSDEDGKKESTMNEENEKPKINKVPIKVKMNDGTEVMKHLDVPTYAKLYPEFISRELRKQHNLKRDDYDTAEISEKDVVAHEKGLKEATLAGPETGPKKIDGAPDPFKDIKKRIKSLKEQIGNQTTQRPIQQNQRPMQSSAPVSTERSQTQTQTPRTEPIQNRSQVTQRSTPNTEYISSGPDYSRTANRKTIPNNIPSNNGAGTANVSDQQQKMQPIRENETIKYIRQLAMRNKK